jgi:segregation and condensation protein B
MEDLTQHIARTEAVLFSEGGEMPVSELLTALGISADELQQLCEAYNSSGRGLVILRDSKKIALRAASEYADLIETLRKERLQEALSKAALEVLAIVLYSDADAVSASEVEHIRGVKSGYILRQLTIRGLLSKAKRGMGYVYSPTLELLSLLGVTQLEALPGVAEVQQKVRAFKQSESKEHDGADI